MSTPTIAMRASATALVLATIAAAPAIAQPQDVIGGIPVIDKLDVNRLPRGQLTRYWFKGSETNTGQGLYIPVIVARGAEDGPRLLLNSGIHGDELNGIRVVQTVMAELDLATLKGTIIGIPGLNRSGILNGNRRMYLSAGGGSNDDLNRIMPGTEDKGDAGARYNGRIWNRLWAGNVDMMIDLHTQGTGMEYPLFVYADVRLDKVRALAEAIAPDIIKYDPGEPGSVETEFDKVKIPAITFEIGRAKTWQQDKIIRAIAGVRRVLVTFNMTPPPATPGSASNHRRTVRMKEPLTTSAESSALAAAGAPACAGGSQRCSGNSAVLAARPAVISASATNTTGSGCATRDSRTMSSVP